MTPLATFSAVRYAGARQLLGAMHMATQRPRLRGVRGLRFAKLMGSGSGIGFNARPDPSLWALFAVWESPDDWVRFRDESMVMRQYRERGEEIYSLLLRPVASHGRWSGCEPFGTLPDSPTPAPDEPLVVLTRAAIRLRRLVHFWSQVPSVDATLRGHPELLLSFGVGEAPWIRQATLSVWRSDAGMRSWAYGSPHHREVVRRTREEGWYTEELFARFRLVGREGGIGGADPLREIAAAPG
ncbi:MAG: hypothetical protein M3409_10905 [Gemmatimonadota bacterium]|nr:hypothetical protein [Gemmatimonadota bacterium]